MKPMLFSTPMVQALLNTKPDAWPAEAIDASKPCKSQTRRVIKPIPEYDFLYPVPIDGEWFWTECDTDDDMMGWWPSYDKGLSARYQVGDILYVRETFGEKFVRDIEGEYISTGYVYKAGYNHDLIFDLNGRKWRPSIHMPREAARLFLEVKSVRVERLQDITEADAKAEGAEYFDLFKLKQIPTTILMPGGAFGKGYMPKASYKAGFYKIWQELNEKRGYSWDSNPWVWVYEFARVEVVK